LVSCGHYCLSFVLPHQINPLVYCGHYCLSFVLPYQITPLVSCGHYCLSFVLPYQITSLVSCGHYVCRYLHTFPNLHYLYTLYVYIYIYLYTNEILTFCFLRSALFTLPDIIPHFRSGGFMEVCKSDEF
jgi:hypothetical protein